MNAPATDATASAGGKVVLITRASSGIGEATSGRLAAAGHRVALGARRSDRIAALAKDIRAAGGSAVHHELDVTSLESMRAFVRAAQDAYGRVDVLVNNAGVMPLSPLDALKVDEWNRMIDVNIRGVLHGIAAVLPVMRAQRTGHVVNIASVSGHRVDPTAAVYSATKFAVRALSEGLRQESRDGASHRDQPRSDPQRTDRGHQRLRGAGRRAGPDGHRDPRLGDRRSDPLRDQASPPTSTSTNSSSDPPPQG